MRYFWSQIQAFLYFSKFLQLEKPEGADFKSDNSFFKILAQKYLHEAFLVKNTQVKHVLSPKVRYFLFFRQILQLDKFEGADFKYDNSFLKLLLKNTQIRHFGPKFRYVLLFAKFCDQTNLRVLIFKILAQKY